MRLRVGMEVDRTFANCTLLLATTSSIRQQQRTVRERPVHIL